MSINYGYDLSNEILDELQISAYCLIATARENNNKIYKIYTLNYLSYLGHLLDTIKQTFNNKLVYNTNSEFIDDADLRQIAFNMLFILLHHNSKSSLFNYVTSIFDYEYSFNILTNIALLESDLNMLLEKELDMEFFILDIFNIQQEYGNMDLIARGRTDG